VDTGIDGRKCRVTVNSSWCLRYTECRGLLSEILRCRRNNAVIIIIVVIVTALTLCNLDRYIVSVRL
jgi:hypothetical protein